ncbi:MAG: cupin domain-containing protein [Actinobacteria bacterium]|nr:cupin domain-containing protein [Actinomycetota bacterium]MSW76713.1 cupin domain-containing protein [Actinomycetota bacterium]MSX55341.1 cupin domain-containing protein [Actinomycetota bacterium]MSX92426.1 cupin domain-containing protein [Actinomycetota bacterium]MSZ82160.1 cupin domain-containing protein [Actinomycetota bacterium]
MDPMVEALIEHYGMTPLPVEETYFVSTWRSTAEMPDGGPIGTAMIGLYAAEPSSRSLFHRLSFDETWHFYGGDPIRLVLLHPDGTSEDVVMGPDVLAGQRVQYVLSAGVWQAGELVAGGRWALFGCTLAPGFTGTCFEGGHAGELLQSYPSRSDDIVRLAIADDHETAMPDGFAP